ncbi:EamA domain-containing protein [Fadolivirus algeromassiliense]|jgi:uncharacterized membrane protein|uniref:EamA domain-containing protein n=1 Tax=Fadolivirus FV1/VV64 TaxID=3070911 RepID=A0A7D3UVW9_9VIRU|nr:EamA domain-containing protein [Fadolivirus algeromassiliense]QKF94414.1 EamA domain-containing protein [Fadolivirus FV1/VV64]
MDQSNSTYILLALLILSFTFTPFLRKKILHEFTDEEFYIYSNIIMFTIVILYAIYLLKTNKCSLSMIKEKVNARNVVICTISAITGLAGSILLMMLLKRNDASFVIPQVQPVVILLTMLLGFFMANEDINRFKILGTMLIILGLVAINYGKNGDGKK